MSWIGVDLDGTLAEYHSWEIDRDIGKPVPQMVQRVKNWLADNKEVRVVTARAGLGDHEIGKITDWLIRAGLPALRVTDRKDFGMIELWDDRAVTVAFNEGVPVLSDLQIAEQRMKRRPKV